MKLSVSVPDELWVAVAEVDGSPSQIVQESLRLLAAQRQQAFPTAAGSFYAEPDNESELAEAVDKLAAQAAELRGKGYSIGIDLARALPWPTLDVLPTGSALTRQLRGWVDEADVELPDDVSGVLLSLLSDWQEGLDDSGEWPVWSPTLFEGIVAGIDETRDAVRRRLRAAVTASNAEPSS